MRLPGPCPGTGSPGCPPAAVPPAPGCVAPATAAVPGRPGPPPGRGHRRGAGAPPGLPAGSARRCPCSPRTSRPTGPRRQGRTDRCPHGSRRTGFGRRPDPPRRDSPSPWSPRIAGSCHWGPLPWAGRGCLLLPPDVRRWMKEKSMDGGLRDWLAGLSRRELALFILLGVAAVAGAGLWYVRSLPTPVEVRAGPPAPAASASPEPLFVHVDGWVREPGVYHLEQGDRVIDAIDLAGGPRRGAE